MTRSFYGDQNYRPMGMLKNQVIHLSPGGSFAVGTGAEIAKHEMLKKRTKNNPQIFTV